MVSHRLFSTNIWILMDNEDPDKDRAFKMNTSLAGGFLTAIVWDYF